MTWTELFKGLCAHPDEVLLEALVKAHYTAAADNANLSKQVVAQAGAGSADFGKAAAAGLLSLGGIHGPVVQARKLLREATSDKITEILSDKSLRIPGWGNSFFKDKMDPAWTEVASLLRQRPVWKKIQMIDDAIRNHGKKIHPNAAIFSAASLEELGWVDGTEMALILVARSPVWALEFARVIQSLPKIAH